MSDVTGRKAVGAVRDGGEIQVLGAEPSFPATVAIRVKNGPISGIDISPDGSRLMVTNYGDNSVSVIDTDTCRVMETLTGIDEPFAIAMGGAQGDRAYISTVSASYDAIEVIDTSTNAIIATHPLALSVSDLTVSPDGKYVYASRNGARGADVAVLDTTTDQVEVLDIATMVGTATECVRVSPDGSRVYVGTNGPSGGQVVVIATRAQSAGRSRWRRKSSKSSKSAKNDEQKTCLHVVDTIDIGGSIRDIALSPDGAVAYVASCGPDFGALVDVIDTRTNKITSTRKVGEIGGLVTRLTVSGNADRAYLVSEDRVTLLCTRKQDVIATIRTNQPSCVVESPDGKYLYIADYAGMVTMAPVDSTVVSGESDIELQALESDRSVDWMLPELLQYEPALA